MYPLDLSSTGMYSVIFTGSRQDNEGKAPDPIIYVLEIPACLSIQILKPVILNRVDPVSIKLGHWQRLAVGISCTAPAAWMQPAQAVYWAASCMSPAVC